MALPKIDFNGNLTADPEVVTNPNTGKPYTRFTVACNGKQDANNPDRKPDEAFLQCVAYGYLGEHIAKSLKKGMNVIGNGQLSTYKDEKTFYQKDGQYIAGVNRPSIVVWELGPSLVFQEAVVTKSATSGGNGGNFADPNQQGQAASGQQAAPAPVQQAAAPAPAQQVAPAAGDPSDF